MEKTNPELIDLYREHANHLKTGEQISLETLQKIEKLERRPVIISTVTQNRENELRETIRKFEELLSKGFSKAKAAKMLGYADHTPIWKKYEELRRIETEKKAKQTFKDSLKVSKEQLQANNSEANNIPTVEAKIQTTETEK